MLGSSGSFIYVIYVYFHNRFIDDSLLVTIRENSLQRYVEKGLTGEELERTMAAVERLFQPAPFSVQVFLMLTLTGVLGSLLLAAIMRKKKLPGEAPVSTAASAAESAR